MKLTQAELAQRMDVSVQTVNLLINGKRAVTAETALALARTLETTPETRLRGARKKTAGVVP